MESRAFITSAKVLIEELQTFAATFLSDEEANTQGQALQKRVNNLFSGLQNPTLPSAYKLRDAALQGGFYVDPRVLQRIGALENIHS